MTVTDLASRRNHPDRIVSDDEMGRALDWLRDSAREMGEAKKRLKKAEHMVKVIAAIEFKRSDAKSVDARKADAITSDKYMDAINEDAEATGAFEMMRSLREAAALKIETWRSEQANYRAMKI